MLGAKAADPSLPYVREEGGSGDLHRLNAQGGSQGLPPWWSLLATRGAREGTCSLGARPIPRLVDQKRFAKGPPPSKPL